MEKVVKTTGLIRRVRIIKKDEQEKNMTGNPVLKISLDKPIINLDTIN
jgi:hypothetical protein